VAGFRLGHSLIGCFVRAVDASGRPTQTFSISDGFFSPQAILNNPSLMDDILRGLMTTKSQKPDLKIADSLRNRLFAKPNSQSLDLSAIDIERGRDHGLSDYNTMRRFFGLGPISSFSDFDSSTSGPMSRVYSSISQIDPWIGMLAEKPTGTSMFGKCHTQRTAFAIH
jgi:peroxidase